MKNYPQIFRAKTGCSLSLPITKVNCRRHETNSEASCALPASIAALPGWRADGSLGAKKNKQMEPETIFDEEICVFFVD